jgi:hypothetical protein
MTKAEKAYYDRLARYGCALCIKLGLADEESGNAEIHHIRRGGKRSMAVVVPICPYHHRSSNSSIHLMGRKLFERTFGTEEALAEMVQTKFQSIVPEDQAKALELLNK